MPYTLLVDAGASQYRLDFIRLSDAMNDFWHTVAAQPDDGESMSRRADGLLAARTGMADGKRWYVHLIEN